jgi:glucose/arabinose dehydrogenase
MKTYIFCFLFSVATLACVNNSKQPAATTAGDSAAAGMDRANTQDTLPIPFATESVSNPSKLVAWPAGKTPIAPEGFVVTRWADGFDHPRWIYAAPNGDILVAESNTEVSGLKKIGAKFSPKAKSQQLGSSANRISLLRDENKDGSYEKRYHFASNLQQPLGMLILNRHFYAANTDAVLQYDYTPGDTAVKGPAKLIVSLPAGGYNNHWTRNIIASKDGNKIYVSVGSGSNVAEHGMENEQRRANILQLNPDGSGEKIYASGLRNPVGMDWEPATGRLWTAVNERDELGDELVPDYITSVQEDGFYGWPYSYFGQHEDPRMKDKQQPALVKKAIIPDLAVGAHTASLGLSFYTKDQFPALYRGGAFVGQHGSWNRSILSGYKVLYVPFTNGKPSGKPIDFLTGFMANQSAGEVFGRPAGVAVMNDGSLLVADDVSNVIWKVSYRN